MTGRLKNLKVMGMTSNEVSIETARKELGDYVNRAALAGVETVITRNGKPVARIVPLDDPEKRVRDLAESLYFDYEHDAKGIIAKQHAGAMDWTDFADQARSLLAEGCERCK